MVGAQVWEGRPPPCYTAPPPIQKPGLSPGFLFARSARVRGLLRRDAVRGVGVTLLLLRRFSPIGLSFLHPTGGWPGHHTPVNQPLARDGSLSTPDTGFVSNRVHWSIRPNSAA